MAFEGEPRNGDYAAYIDKLVNSGSRAPGQVLRELDSIAGKARHDTRGHTRARSRWEDDDVLDASPWPALPPANPAPAPVPAAQPPREAVQPVTWETPAPGATTPAPAAEAPDTLASRNRAQRRSLGGLLVGGILALFGLNKVIVAMANDGDGLVGGIFLLVFAWTFLRMGSKDKAGARKPLMKLPPLSTIARKDAPPR
ncbi:hypothetical protein [Orrella dioscoreae]|uniref:Transmembrane protein n=1 Tax=Orrella dioscoreae TaxID=1851544 RepID=A0A1C3K1K8_9BURK|nr:hypothetical protein [Orrella dioscoreae]SBT25267.1 hypothetical protein ODI_01582 [Orrella dioscoreae]SOE49022.1 hypothetical protein ODI_R1792 [Orrella dioscoreae]